MSTENRDPMVVEPVFDDIEYKPVIEAKYPPQNEWRPHAPKGTKRPQGTVPSRSDPIQQTDFEARLALINANADDEYISHIDCPQSLLRATFGKVIISDQSTDLRSLAN
jgi:hypothetical protein